MIQQFNAKSKGVFAVYEITVGLHRVNLAEALALKSDRMLKYCYTSVDDQAQQNKIYGKPCAKSFVC